ncbi:MAG: protein translocase subunit SecD [Actinomycetes bacterium]
MASRKRARRGLGGLLVIVLVAIFAFTYTIVSGDRPLLGLDLQGGVSLVLCPASPSNPQECKKPGDPAISEDTLNQAIKIIRSRVDALGVAEPDISRQGSNVLVQIPGVKDKQRALDLVGQTAALQFRPVLAEYPAPVAVDTTSSTDSTTPDTAPGDTSTTDASGNGATPPSTSGSTDTSQQGMRATTKWVEGESAAAFETAQAPATTDSTGGLTASLPSDATATTSAPQATATPQTATSSAPPLTPADQITPEATVVLPQVDPKTKQTIAIYQLGPVVVEGSSLESASAGLDQSGKWEIRPVFKSGVDGIDKFNTAAGQCNPASATCPTGRLAVVLDNQVLTAPSIKVASFARDQITISGNYTEGDAKDIATALRYGALPVVLFPQQTESVSATLGRDALHAGLVAGLVGFILVGLYMIAFYRFLGVLAMVKLLIEGSILWGLLCYLSSSVGLALTLAGITGIIVSIGVSLDSNVVYYEHLKEDVRSGRTVRAAIDKSFASAWSTIVAADGASVIGAALLYFLTVGAVRGFALYLGLSTVLDLITSYFYMRPVVRWATNSKRCAEHPGQFGLPVPMLEPKNAVANHVTVSTGGES